MKTHEEKSGSAKPEGRATDTVKKIADMLKQRFQELGWIQETCTEIQDPGASGTIRYVF